MDAQHAFSEADIVVITAPTDTVKKNSFDTKSVEELL